LRREKKTNLYFPASIVFQLKKGRRIEEKRESEEVLWEDGVSRRARLSMSEFRSIW
jgi:hypothetical protein